MTLSKNLEKLNNNYIFSRYFRYIKRGNKIVIFHELRPAPVFLNLKEWNSFLKKTAFSKKIFRELRAQKLILKSKKEDDRFLKRVKLNFNKKLNKTFILYLVLTKDCNYCCSYCPFKKLKNNKKLNLMSSDILISGINLWKNHIPKEDYFNNYSIIFYGGEPLLNLDVIKTGLSYIEDLKKKKELPKKLKILVPTNGSLIKDDTIKLFKRYKVMVTIGLDGINSNQNMTRKTKKKSGTFKIAMNTIKKLIKNKINTSLSITITPDNINKIDKFSTFFNKMGIKKIGFNFLKGGAMLSIIKQNNVVKYYTEATDNLIKGFLKQKNPRYEFQMEKKFISFFKKDFFPIDCTCYGNQLVIMPDGRITNCPFYGKSLGNLKTVSKNFKIWNTKEVKKLQKRFLLLDKKQENFYWKSLYGGGCAWNSKEIYGNINAIDEGMNIFAKKVFDFFLWSKLSKTLSKNEK